MSKQWTQREHKILLENYPVGGWEAAYLALEAAGYQRTQQAIIVAASKAGLKDGKSPGGWRKNGGTVHG